jgi:hypothetical protein
LNLREALTKEHSKRNTEAIVNYIGNDAALFRQLIDIIKTEDYRLVQRASWVLSYVVAKTPELIYPHLGMLLKLLNKPHHDAYKRNVFRLLRNMSTIPEKHHAEVIDHCMTAIPDVAQPAAIRTFAIHVMGKMARIYPELCGELSMIAEPLTEHEMPSIRSGAKHLMKQISK